MEKLRHAIIKLLIKYSLKEEEDVETVEDGAVHLSLKLKKYIRQIASQSMG
jgi:hypothetical protein